MAELLRAEGLCKSFHKDKRPIEVLKGTNLTLQAGDLVSITGASGAGKSTLLHILGTLDRPDAGEIYFQNEKLSKLSPTALADFRNRHLGFVFQFHHLLNEFDALENVMLPGLIQRLPDKVAKTAAQEALAAVGLSHRQTHRPHELSGGEKQRVAIARALVLQPQLFLADEVTGDLDETTAENIHQLLFDLNAQLGLTMVVVTHNRSLAERMPRRLTLVAGGLECK